MTGGEIDPDSPQDLLPKRDLHLLRAEKMMVSLHKDSSFLGMYIQTIYGRLEEFLVVAIATDGDF